MYKITAKYSDGKPFVVRKRFRTPEAAKNYVVKRPKIKSASIRYESKAH